jgi:hypothetical protein
MIRTYRQMLRARSMDELKARARAIPELTVHERDGVLDAYVNHGRWVADCDCGSGVACGPDSRDAVCFECGAVWRVKFPRSDRIDAAVAILDGRRYAKQRNWRPDRGETLDDLRAENAAADILGQR